MITCIYLQLHVIGTHVINKSIWMFMLRHGQQKHIDGFSETWQTKTYRRFYRDIKNGEMLMQHMGWVKYK